MLKLTRLMSWGGMLLLSILPLAAQNSVDVMG
jgi:hypothetical protein